MKKTLLKIHLLFILCTMISSHLAKGQGSITPATVIVKGGDCSSIPGENEITFDLTTMVPNAPGYSWRIDCASTGGASFPPAGSITVVGGGGTNSSPCGGGPATEISNTGSNKQLVLKFNNLTAGTTRDFSLSVYPSGPTGGTAIVSQDIILNVTGDCVAPVCCTIHSEPNPIDDDKNPGETFTPITLSEQNNTTTGLTWKIQIEDPGAPGTFIDAAALTDLPGVGLSATGADGTFTEITSTAPVVYFGGNASGTVGTKKKMRLTVSHALGHHETPPFTYSIGVPGAGNALIIPLSVKDTRTPPVSLANCNVALDPLSFKTQVDQAAAWITTVSNGKAPAVLPILYSDVVIDKQGLDLKDYFNRDDEADNFVQFATDALTQVAIDAAVLGGKRNIILVLNHCLESKEGKIGHYATMQQITFNSTNYQVAVMGRNNTWKDVAHALANNFGIKDIFDLASPPATSRPTLKDWEEMAKTHSGTLPFSGAQPSVFSKLSPNEWITYASVQSVDPGSGTTTSGPFNIVFPHITPTSPEKRGIAILLDNGTSTNASLSSITKKYVIIEARDKTAPDDNLKAANGGVIYYFTDKSTPEGYSPITTTGGTLPLTAGNSTSASDELFKKYGIKISGISNYPASGTQKGYAVTIEHQQPPKGDMAITTGNPSWTSPDISVDIIASTGGVCNQGDMFSTTLQNKINAKFRNTSTTIPVTNVQAHFLFGCPTPSFAWYKIGSTLIGDVTGPADVISSMILNPLQAYPKESGSGTKTVANCIADGASHICVKVELTALNDEATSNNSAQQNLDRKTTCTSSPYPPIENVFYIRNKESYRTPVYLKAEKIPTNWTHSFTPASLNLGPDEEAKVTLRLTPPEGFPHCSDFHIPITAWAPKGHTIVQLGGLSVIAQLREGTKLNMENKPGRCRIDSLVNVNRDIGRNATHAAASDEIKHPYHTYNNQNYWNMLTRFTGTVYQGDRKEPRECQSIYSSGCTEPKRPNQLVKVMYQDPAGNPIVKEVMTDANGCFTDEFVVLEGGTWTITAIYNGDNCIGGAIVTKEIRVSIPGDGDQDDDDLPDDKEVHGDFDFDDLPGYLDQDSDNDNIPDGKEPTGDYDCDGLPNSIDPDSDNDGVKDGGDASPYGSMPQYKVFFSAMYHRFDFSSDLPIEDGSGFNIRAGINLNSKWGVEAEGGFTSTKDILEKSGTVTNINLNALYYIKNGPVTPYVTAGAGGLLFNGFTATDNTFALNGGLGIFGAPPGMSGALALRAEIKGHYGFGGYNTNGNFNLQYSLGIAYRIRTTSTPCRIDKVSRAARRK